MNTDPAGVGLVGFCCN